MLLLAKRTRRLALAISLIFFVLAAASCRDEEPATPPTPPRRGLLRIGLIPEHNLFAQKARYQPIADYLATKLHTRIELKILSRYGNIIENFVSARLDGAFFGSFTGALAHEKLRVEPLARPEYPDGTSTYYGMIFVRADSGIRQVQDMRGKRFAFVDKATTAGWLLPLYYFKSRAIEDPDSWLAETYFAGSHEGAIYDVLEGKADIGAAKNAVFERLSQTDPRLTSELLILATSPEVPENTLSVRDDLDESIKAELRDSLLGMDRDEEGVEILREFGARRFIETTDADYAVVFEFAKTIGLDLKTYDYLND